MDSKLFLSQLPQNEIIKLTVEQIQNVLLLNKSL